MPFGFQLAKHPQTKEPLLVVMAQPEPWNAARVTELLRLIKRAFPAEYRAVHYEIVGPVNGSPPLETPEEIAERKADD